MARRTSGLADRLRAAVEREQRSDPPEDPARLDRLAEGRAARDALFADLEAFGKDAGFLEVLRRPDGVQLAWNGRSIRFVARGEGEAVGVDYATMATGETQRLYREAALGQRWIWVRTRGAREDRLPLFDQGLEVLLVHALGLPEPEAPGVSEPEPPQRDEVPPAGPDGVKRRL